MAIKKKTTIKKAKKKIAQTKTKKPAKKPNIKSDGIIKKTKKAVKKKAIVKKPVLKNIVPKPSGKVVHYFGNIKVAVLKMKVNVKAGQTLRFSGGENTDFQQKISSMQFNHQPIKQAKKGQEFAIKIKKPVREGYRVYL